MKHAGITSTFGAAALVVALGAGLTACGEEEPTGDAAAAADTTTESGGVSIEDPWIKVAQKGRTAAFGVLVNDGDEDVVVVSATSEVATSIELHETSMGEDGELVMQATEDGFVIPAGGAHVLKPGGDHLMVMGLTRPIEVGEAVVITLTLEDGSTMEVSVVGRDLDAADAADADHPQGDRDKKDKGADKGADPDHDHDDHEH